MSLPAAGSAHTSLHSLLLYIFLKGVGHVRASLGELLRTHQSLFQTFKSLLQRKWFYVWFCSFYLMMLFGLPATPPGWGLMILALRLIKLDGQELDGVLYGGRAEETRHIHQQALASVLLRLAFDFLSLFLAFESNAAGMGGILLGVLLVDPLFGAARASVPSVPSTASTASRSADIQKTPLLDLPESEPVARISALCKRRSGKRRARVPSERVSKELQSNRATEERPEKQQPEGKQLEDPFVASKPSPQGQALQMRIPTPDTVRHESGDTSPDIVQDEAQITPDTSVEYLSNSNSNIDHQSHRSRSGPRSRSISPTPNPRSRSHSHSPVSPVSAENLLANEAFTLLELHLDDWVVLHDGREGIVRFLGSCMSSATEWIGIELVPDISVNGPIFTDQVDDNDTDCQSEGDNQLIVRPSAIASVLHPQPPPSRPRNSVMSVGTMRTLASIVEEWEVEGEASRTAGQHSRNEVDSDDGSESESDTASEREANVVRHDHSFWSGRLDAPTYSQRHGGDSSHARLSQRTDISHAPTIFDAGHFDPGHFSRRGSEESLFDTTDEAPTDSSEEPSVRVSICEGDTDDFEARMGMLVDGLDDMLAGTSGWSEVGMGAAQDQACVHPAFRKTWAAQGVQVPLVRTRPGSSAENRPATSRGAVQGAGGVAGAGFGLGDTLKTPTKSGTSTKKISRKVRVAWRGLTKGIGAHAGMDEGTVGGF